VLTVKQAAERAGVSPGLVYEWCNCGMLPHLRLGRPGTRGGIRIEESDLAAFLASQKRKGRPVPPPSPKKPPIRLKHLGLS
jgi:excisionase family DNA binding protein